jgi:hypothetical protein
MKVYYKKGWGVSFTIFGVILLFANLWLLSKGFGQPLQLLVCGMLTLIGIMYLVQPCFELRNSEIVVFNLFGMPVKTYAFKSYSDLQVVDNKIYLNTNGKSRKVRVSKIMARTNEWNAFIAKITGEDLSNELHNI